MRFCFYLALTRFPFVLTQITQSTSQSQLSPHKSHTAAAVGKIEKAALLAASPGMSEEEAATKALSAVQAKKGELRAPCYCSVLMCLRRVPACVINFCSQFVRVCVLSFIRAFVCVFFSVPSVFACRVF